MTLTEATKTSLPLLRYDEVGSTSDLARQLLSGGEHKAPFAVTAAKQTAGRGQRGKSWMSPPGNLYLTLVLPPGHLSRDDLTHLPLLAAITVARWARHRFHLRLTVRWPNDLLFAGAKLAGILCESSVRGQQAEEILIGIGINLGFAPETTDGRVTTCLEKISGRKVDPEEAAVSLVNWFHQTWQNLTPGALITPGDTADWCLPSGSLFIRSGEDSPAGLCRLTGFGEDGAMNLQERSSGKARRLVSASQDFRWIYQAEGPDWPLLVADLGNTSWKLAYYAQARGSGHPDLLLQGSWHEPERLADLQQLRNLPGLKRVGRPWPVYICSVSPRAEDVFHEALAGLDLTGLRPGKYPLRWRGSYDLQQMGIDRLALMEAVLATREPDQAMVAVSAGTATTIDCIDRQGVHRGGWILPGVRMKLAALHRDTGALPDLVDTLPDDPLATDDPLGQNTTEAMIRGAALETLHLIRHVLAKDGLDAATDLRITGGSGAWLARQLDGVHIPDLIPAGIRQLVLGGI